MMETTEVFDSASDGEEHHPWPYLKSLFTFRVRHGNAIKFLCVLCAPLRKEVSAYANSPSNLRKHVEVS